MTNYVYHHMAEIQETNDRFINNRVTFIISLYGGEPFIWWRAMQDIDIHLSLNVFL